MEQVTRTLWDTINKEFIPLILNAINDPTLPRQEMYYWVDKRHTRMSAFIDGYLYMASCDETELFENYSLATELCRDIWDEFWEIYTNY